MDAIVSAVFLICNLNAALISNNEVILVSTRNNDVIAQRHIESLLGREGIDFLRTRSVAFNYIIEGNSKKIADLINNEAPSTHFNIKVSSGNKSERDFLGKPLGGSIFVRMPDVGKLKSLPFSFKLLKHLMVEGEQIQTLVYRPVAYLDGKRYQVGYEVHLVYLNSEAKGQIMRNKAYRFPY